LAAASERSYSNHRERLPPVTSEKVVRGPAIVPPGADAAWDPVLLSNTERRVAFHSLFRGGEDSSVSVIGGVLGIDECQAWIQYGEEAGFELAKHAATAYVAHRDCWRLVVEDEEKAANIFRRIRSFVPETLILPGSQRVYKPTSCAKNLRLYKYTEGQRFGKHYDGAQDTDDGGITCFTVLLYLNGDGGSGGGPPDGSRASGSGKRKGKCELPSNGAAEGDEVAEGGEVDGKANGLPFVRGGQTMFYDTPSDLACQFTPRAGYVLMHSHGHNCLLHEGGVVLSGVKYLLRTDVVYT